MFAVAVALVVALVAQYVYAMATTSLWIDEYYTQTEFAGKGAWTAWTDYHVPNNHILFSIANSIWPERLAHEPLPARLFSFLATIATFVVVGWFAVRERAWGGGALALLLLASIQTLDLTLQARGYGFAMLAAVVQAIATARYLEDGARAWLVAVAAAAFAAVATVPICVLLAAPLALGLLILRPRREVVVVLGLAAVAGVAFYLPTAGQILTAASSYADEWGARYTTIAAVGQSLLYVLPEGPLGVVCAAAFVLVVVAAMLRGSPSRRGFLVLGLASLAVFFAACLVMATPRTRTTQFAVAILPVLLVAASGVSGLRPRRVWIAGNVLLLVLAVPLAVEAVTRLRGLAFKPIEAWREAAEIVNAVAAPDTPVHVTFRAAQLAVHLDGPDRIVDAFSADDFRRGELVVVDSSFREAVRFAGSDHAPEAIDTLVPQRRGGRQVVSFVPRTVPLALEAPSAAATDLARLVDGDIGSGWRGRKRAALTLTPETACERLILLGSRPGFADSIDIRLGPRGTGVAAGDRLARFDRLAVVDLRGLAAAPIHVAPHRDDRRLAIAEAWCTPPRDAAGQPLLEGSAPPRLEFEPPAQRLPPGASLPDAPIGEPLAPR